MLLHILQILGIVWITLAIISFFVSSYLCYAWFTTPSTDYEKGYDAGVAYCLAEAEEDTGFEINSELSEVDHDLSTVW